MYSDEEIVDCGSCRYLVDKMFCINPDGAALELRVSGEICCLNFKRV